MHRLAAPADLVRASFAEGEAWAGQGAGPGADQDRCGRLVGADVLASCSMRWVVFTVSPTMP